MPSNLELQNMWKSFNEQRLKEGKLPLEFGEWFKEIYKVESLKESHDPKRERNPEIEEVLAFIGVTQDNTFKKIAYEHWYRVVELGIRMSGREWQTVRSFMRSYVNVDFRYIDDYMKSLKAWEIFSINNGVLHFNGIPKKFEDNQSVDSEGLE